jgi:hypothetical protein
MAYFNLVEVKSLDFFKKWAHKGRAPIFSFGLFVFTSKKSTHEEMQSLKGFNRLESLRLPTAGRLPLLSKKREYSRKDAEPQRLCAFSLRLSYFARIKKGITAAQ